MTPRPLYYLADIPDPIISRADGYLLTDEELEAFAAAVRSTKLYQERLGLMPYLSAEMKRLVWVVPQHRRDMLGAGPCVYLAVAPKLRPNQIKIGQAGKLLTRLNSLRREYPGLSIMAYTVTQEAKKLERALHLNFDRAFSRNITGEWFDGDRVLAFLFNNSRVMRGGVE